MDGLTPSELSMIHKLAGNDPMVRKKTMKKMKIWLKALSIKIPDTPDCREMAENNFIRVWKALFYCMWMADKPLPQEQLAEQISNLVEIFADKPNVFNLFVEWFFRTLAREWPHIDRFRLDKFMMLARRLLRKTLMVIEERKWKLDILDGFLKTITFNVFNRRPETKSTRAKTREPAIEVAPFGLQSHVVDIFLEELAKAGGSGIKSQKVIKIITPFVNELAFNDDERMLDQIQERVFNHLMRQSDAGIDYAEGGVAGGEEEGEGEGGNLEENGADSEDDEMVAIPLDPRAGKVDVILPQIHVDYADLAKKLLEVGGQKHVKPKNRKLCYTMARKFQEVNSGSFPLAVDLEVPTGPAVSRKEVSAAALRLLEVEEEMTTHTRKNRKPKKQRIREAKRKAAAGGDQDDSLTSENDTNSAYLQDEDLLEHVTDNYLSYLEEEHQNGDDHEDQDEEEEEGEENGVAGLDKSFTGFDDEVEEDDEEQEENQPSSSKNVKSKKVKKPKYKTVVEVEADEVDTTPTPAILSEKNQKRRRSLRSEETTPTSTPQLTVKTNRRGSMGKRSLSHDNDDSEGNTEESEDDTVVNIKNRNKFRKKSLNDTISRGMRHSTPSNIMTPGTPTSAKRKRVSFVLARNLEHPHADYEQSINRSPQLPFLPEKRPSFGLLKQKFTPTSPLATTSTPRRRTSRI